MCQDPSIEALRVRVQPWDMILSLVLNHMAELTFGCDVATPLIQYLLCQNFIGRGFQFPESSVIDAFHISVVNESIHRCTCELSMLCPMPYGLCSLIIRYYRAQVEGCQFA